MKINGKDVNVILDLGGMKKFKELTGKNFFSLGADIDPDLLGTLIQITAERGGTPITDEEVNKLTIAELTVIQKEMVKGLELGEQAPLAVSRQK